MIYFIAGSYWLILWLIAELAPKTLVTKVAHHGSADQSPRFYRALDSEYLVFQLVKTTMVILPIQPYHWPGKVVLRFVGPTNWGTSPWGTIKSFAIATAVN